MTVVFSNDGQWYSLPNVALNLWLSVERRGDDAQRKSVRTTGMIKGRRAALDDDNPLVREYLIAARASR